MTSSVESQAVVFLINFGCGILIALIFDFFRIFRKLIPSGVIQTVIHDLTFCVISLIIIMLFAIRYNYGQIRWYMLFAILSGGALYFVTFSKLIIASILFLIKLVIKVFMIPIKIFIKIFKKPIIVTLKLGKISLSRFKTYISPIKKYISILQKRKNMV